MTCLERILTSKSAQALFDIVLGLELDPQEEARPERKTAIKESAVTVVIGTLVGIVMLLSARYFTDDSVPISVWSNVIGLAAPTLVGVIFGSYSGHSRCATRSRGGAQI